MRILPRLLYFLCSVGFALVAAFALNRMLEPSMAELLLRAVVGASFAAAPGLVQRRAWPAALVLLPVGAYLLARTIIPLPSAVEGIGGQYHFYLAELRLGAGAYAAQFFPLSLAGAPELRLLLGMTVYWLSGAAAFLSLSLRRPIPSIVIVLVVLGFSLTVDASGRVIWLALLFVMLAVCLLVLSHGVERKAWRPRELFAGGAVGAAAALLALILLVAAPSAAATSSRNWRAWDPFRQGGSVYTFNWLQNYPKLLDPSNNVVIMKVESPTPSYWRANALDTFTGSAWITSQAFLTQLEVARTGDSYVYAMPASEPTPAGEQVTETFQIQAVFTNYLFVGGDPRYLSIGQSVDLRTNEARSLHLNKTLGPTLAYSLAAVIPDLKPAQLVGRGANYPENLNRYLALPFSRAAEIEGEDREATWRSTMSESEPSGWEWVNLYSLREEILGTTTDPYEITLRVERYLRESYEYSLNPPTSDYSSPYAAFLFDTRSGYCQHFAGAMALLLRYSGIPARVAVGFASGDLGDADIYTVSTNNAHAWVEVYFPEVGWVAFDPTPGRSIPNAGPSSTSPGFINPFGDSDSPATSTVSTNTRDRTPKARATDGQTAGTKGRAWLSWVSWLPWVGGLVLALIGWPLGRGLWRRRNLRRGSREQRLQASFHLLRTELLDYGVVVTPAQTLEEVLCVVRSHLGIDCDRALVERAEAVLFGERRATQNDLDRAESLRQEVKDQLRKQYGWARTGLTWYGVPRSAAAGGTSG